MAEPGGYVMSGWAKVMSGWAKVCFGPPPKFDHWPPQNGRPVVTPCERPYKRRIASEHPEMDKIFKIFRLRRAYMGRTYSSGDFMLFPSKFLYLAIFVSS